MADNEHSRQPTTARDLTSVAAPARCGGSPVEVLRAFLRLGLVSFGGPIAHLGYFRQEFVERRRWLDDRAYSDLVALCQFLPGPASSQAGIALGMLRAGPLGALLAWVGFTLPSAIALIAFGYGVTSMAGIAGSGVIHGLKVVAVAVVAQAVWGMARTLCPDRLRAGLAALAAVLVLSLPTSAGQLTAIALGAVVGWWRVSPVPPARAHPGFGVSRRAGAVALAIFLGLLLALPLAAGAFGGVLAIVDAFYRAGSLVFGGGHVVLPLLESAVVAPGWVSDDAFLAGYGAAQAVPGPLFTFAAYLGTVMQAQPNGWVGGTLCLLAIFVPAALLIVAALPFWDALRRNAGIQSAFAGINAAVVGVLLAALYDPVWTNAIGSRGDFALALACFALLVPGRVSPVLVVIVAAAGGWLLKST
jgi:chromate transporter